MQLRILLNNTSKEQFEKNLKSVDWHQWGYFKFGLNDKNVMLAYKESWKYDVKVCYAGNSSYDYFVLFTPITGYEGLFENAPELLNSLVEDFINFINIDYRKEYSYDSVFCELHSGN